MSKELSFKFNDYIIAIDEPYENDCGYVAIGKKDTKGNIDIWFKSLNEQTVDFYIELQKHIADLEAKLAEKERELETYKKQFNEQAGLCEEFRFQLAEKDKEIEEYKRVCTISHIEDLQVENMLLKCKDQDKISFAVAELEKVKEYCRQEAYHDSYGDYMIVYERRYYEDDEEKIPNDDLMGFLDNQIEELKKEMK